MPKIKFPMPWKKPVVAPKVTMRDLGLIEKDLNEHCRRAGDLQFKIECYKALLNKENQDLATLNNEHARAREKMAADAHEAANKLAAKTHESPVPVEQVNQEQKTESSEKLH